MGELTLALDALLKAYQVPDGSTPYFTAVFKGEPLNLMPSGGQAMARWKVDRVQNPPEGPRVLSGQMMRTAVFKVFCYWPLSPMQGKQTGTEDDITAVMVDLPPRCAVPNLTAADYTLGGLGIAAITVEDIEPVTRELPTPDAVAECRVFQFDIHARLLEAS